MASFDKYSNYDEKSSNSSVVFGAEKPVLEVELNEMQQIVATKLSRLIRTSLGGTCLTLLSDANSLTYNAGTKLVRLADAIAVTRSGWTAYISSTTVAVSDSAPIVYLRLQEVTKSYTDTMYNYGNETGTILENTIKDSRVQGETTKRKVVTYKLEAGSSIPQDTDKYKYIPVGVFNPADNTIKHTITNKVVQLEKQLNGIQLSIENGVLYAEYSEEEVI